jgi:acyl-CoA synthetase (AMP-forming)/AMP-acid ligase II
MMAGYWHDPERTAQVVDAEGRLHTGDLGYVGTDGCLRIVGRTKEMYIRGGYNVYPAEVEQALTAHPAIARAAVVGVPDPLMGERGVAFVVAEPGVDAPSLDDVRGWCHDRLADYKAPDRIVVTDDLPVTAMMKIDKQALVAMAGTETG